MAKPIVIDDGGSIRIRELDDDRNMDGLIGSGNPPAFTSASHQQFFGVGSANNRCLLLVTSVDSVAGTITKVPMNPATPPAQPTYGQQLSLGDTVVITTSDSPKQTITVTFTPGGFLNLGLSVGASAKQRGRRRRYTMDSVDSILKVAVNNNPPIFDATNASPVFTAVQFLDQVASALLVEHKAKMK